MTAAVIILFAGYLAITYKIDAIFETV